MRTATLHDITERTEFMNKAQILEKAIKALNSGNADEICAVSNDFKLELEIELLNMPEKRKYSYGQKVRRLCRFLDKKDDRPDWARKYHLTDNMYGKLLPETSHQLRDIGRKLHNCVGSYADKVLSGSCTVVAMTDDEGKLLVCLEVEKGSIRQAKLNQNQSVCADAALNAAVIEWAKAAKLKIATGDINTNGSAELRAAI